MKVPVRRDMQEFIDQKVRSGEYASPEDVVQAGLAALKEREAFGDFASGELDGLLAEGERSLSESGAVDANAALEQRRARRPGRNQPE